MKENISRSSIFRSKMKMEAEKKKTESQEFSKKVKTHKSEYFYSDRRTSLPKSDSER